MCYVGAAVHTEVAHSNPVRSSKPWAEASDTQTDTQTDRRYGFEAIKGPKSSVYDKNQGLGFGSFLAESLFFLELWVLNIQRIEAAERKRFGCGLLFSSPGSGSR